MRGSSKASFKVVAGQLVGRQHAPAAAERHDRHAPALWAVGGVVRQSAQVQALVGAVRTKQPVWWAAARKTSAAPAMAPVCEAAARLPYSVRPPRSTTTVSAAWCVP